MKWFAKAKNLIPDLNEQLETLNAPLPIDALEPTIKNNPTVKAPTIDPLARDVKRRTPVFQPTAYAAIKPIVDELIEHKIILLDFSHLNAADRVRTIDFITGVMYALDGEYKKVEHQVYKFIVRK